MLSLAKLVSLFPRSLYANKKKASKLVLTTKQVRREISLTLADYFNHEEFAITPLQCEMTFTLTKLLIFNLINFSICISLTIELEINRFA